MGNKIRPRELGEAWRAALNELAPTKNINNKTSPTKLESWDFSTVYRATSVLQLEIFWKYTVCEWEMDKSSEDSSLKTIEKQE